MYPVHLKKTRGYVDRYKLQIGLFNYPIFSISECSSWFLVGIAKTSKTSEKISDSRHFFLQESAFKIPASALRPKNKIHRRGTSIKQKFKLLILYFSRMKSKKLGSYGQKTCFFMNLDFDQFFKKKIIKKHFFVLVLMPRISKADFLQEGMSKIVCFFSSFTCLCNSIQDPARNLKSNKMDN